MVGVPKNHETRRFHFRVSNPRRRMATNRLPRHLGALIRAFRTLIVWQDRSGCVLMDATHKTIGPLPSVDQLIQQPQHLPIPRRLRKRLIQEQLQQWRDQQTLPA